MRALPVTGFSARTRPVAARMTAFRFESQDFHSLTDPVLRRTPLAGCDFAMLFAYMHRRFGPPSIPGDDYKDLSAGWLITTPEPDLGLLVRPSLSGAWNSFTLMAEAGAGRPRPGMPDYARFEDAYRAALVDLLRPVNVRDQSFNAMGKLEDDDELMACDERKDEPAYAVGYHPSCGWAMPEGLFGNGKWRDLCTHLRILGDGDILAGRDAFIEERRSKLIDRLKADPDDKPRTVVAGILPGRTSIATLPPPSCRMPPSWRLAARRSNRSEKVRWKPSPA